MSKTNIVFKVPLRVHYARPPFEKPLIQNVKEEEGVSLRKL